MFRLCVGYVSSQQDSPNILFILADDLGWNDIGFPNPSNQLITPNIDSLSKESIILREYYSHCVCSPTRGEILTGRLAIHTGLTGVIAHGAAIGLPLNETLISNTFHLNNYSTHIVGKWHLGYYRWEYTPTFRGFETFYGYFGGGEDYYYHNSSGYYDFTASNKINCGPNCSYIDTNANGIYSSYLFTNRTIQILSNYTSNSQPFFIYLPYQSVHSPTQVPQKYINQYKHTNITDPNRLTKAGMITAMDEGIGQIIDSLKTFNLYNNTIIIFASDNGAPSGKGGSNYPLRGGKHAIWEGGTRTIGLIYIPIKYYNSKPLNNLKTFNYTFLMHCIDWYPTLMQATNINTFINENLDGKSHWNNFINIYNNNITSVRNDIYYGNDNAGSSPDMGPYNNTGYRKHHWKLLNTSGGSPDTWFDQEDLMDIYNMFNTTTYNYSLYNMNSDPNEYHNVANDNPQEVAELANDMMAIQETAVPSLQKNRSCPHVTHPVNPIVGGIWWPWC